MWKILAVAAAIMSLAGCSNDNQISIENRALQTIHFNFRAATYTVLGYNDVTPQKAFGVAGTCTIKDVPNGQYNFGVTYDLPNGAKTWGITDEAGSGGLTFNKKSTRYKMDYNYTFVDGDYQVNLVMSSSDPTSFILSPK